MKEEEQKIINDFLEGDDGAYAYIYNKYVPVLFSYGKGLGFEQETVKDCIHTLFYKILCNRELLRDVHNLSYFLLRSLKNSLLNSIRSSKFIAIEEEHKTSFTISVTILDQMIDQEEKMQLESQLENLLATLTDRQREAIYLRYIQELDYKEVAEILNISVPAARNIVSKAITKMKDTNLILFNLFLSLSSQYMLTIN